MELEKVIKGSEFKLVRGLRNFFSYIDCDELLATTESIVLATRVDCGNLVIVLIMFYSVPTYWAFIETLIRLIFFQRSDEFEFVTKKYLCIIPGMEGHYSRFQVLCERLKLHAFVLQPGFDFLHENFQETAARYAKVFNKHLIQFFFHWNSEVNS